MPKSTHPFRSSELLGRVVLAVRRDWGPSSTVLRAQEILTPTPPQRCGHLPVRASAYLLPGLV